MKTVITDAGISAAIQAGMRGPLVRVTSVKIGSSIILPDSAMTDVTDQVWVGDSSHIQYQIVDDRTFMFKITLDESIGDFDIGNIGLFLDDGTMFAIATLIGVEKKIANNDPVVGNRKIFEIPIVLAGISGVLDVTLLVPDECSLPFVQTEASLPNYQLAPYSVYLINYHTGLKCPALALRTDTGWKYCAAYLDEDTGIFDEGIFDQDVMKGDLVYFDPTTGLFKKADGTDNSKGYLGVRGGSNNIISDGVYINSSWNLTPGARYYAGNNGNLTTTPNDWYVGQAITSTTMLLANSYETVLNKVDSVNSTNPSHIKYLTENAVVNYVASVVSGAESTIIDHVEQEVNDLSTDLDSLTSDLAAEVRNRTNADAAEVTNRNTAIANATTPLQTEINNIKNNYAKKDMSNVGDVTFTGTVRFNNVIQGTANKANWADLAEYYVADAKYPEGTLIRFGGDKEITIATEETKVNSVVTSKPAYVMNCDIENQENATAIALIGRVPVRVVGKVKKFDELTISEIPGVATVSTNAYDKIIGRALEDKTDYEEGLVMCSVNILM